MICFKCNNEESSNFEIRDCLVQQDYNGITIEIMTPLTVCNLCGFQSGTSGQIDELIKRTKAKYKHIITNSIDYTI